MRVLLENPGKFAFLTKGSFKRKALLYFGSFSFFILKKIFSFKSTVRFLSKSSVEKKCLDEECLPCLCSDEIMPETHERTNQNTCKWGTLK